jgi:glycine/D-amino acid oxidase-like deaminating enzyme
LRKRRSADVIVIGAGLVGLSVAYYLARQGISVLVLESGRPGAGSSGSGQGNFVLPIAPGHHLALALESRRLYVELARDLRSDFELQWTGSLRLAQSEQEWEALLDRAVLLRAAGLRPGMLDGPDLSRLEAAVADDLRGGLFLPDDGHLNQLALLQALASDAARMDARILSGCAVHGFVTSGDRLDGVVTQEGEILADRTVLAAGAYSAPLAGQIGLRLPIWPRKGEVLVMEVRRPFLRSVVMDAGHRFGGSLAPEPKENPLATPGIITAVAQARSGTCLVGGSSLFAGFDRSSSRQAIRAIAQRACRLVPALRQARCIRTYVGLRPWTRDAMPILGPVEGMEKLVIAAGHDSLGVTLAPASGKLVADYIATGVISPMMAPYGLGRFVPEGRGGSAP